MIRIKHCYKICVSIFTVMLLLSLSACSHGTISLAIGGGDRVSISTSSSTVDIYEESDILELSDIFTREYNKEKKIDEYDYQFKIIFYGYEDEGNDPVEIAVIDSDTIVYDGWRCSLVSGDIDVGDIEHIMNQQ